jgi:O-methyltransferase
VPLRDLLHKVLPKRGNDLLWQAANRVSYPPDFSPDEVRLCKSVAGLTMTSPERIVSLAQAVTYVVENRIPGAFVECGVWRGGSMMVAAYILLSLGVTDRELYLFDTFEGMAPPGTLDVAYSGKLAADILARTPRKEGDSYWCIASIEDVRTNLLSTRYPAERIHLVKGRVEDTVPAAAPAAIALLRLDTDWYESTEHDLRHLYPRLARGGVTIIDDYGHWKGAKQAVDDFLRSQAPRPLLHRIDYTGRSFIKP